MIFWPDAGSPKESAPKSSMPVVSAPWSTQRSPVVSEIPVSKPTKLVSEEFRESQDLHSFYESKRTSKDPNERILVARAVNLCGDFL